MSYLHQSILLVIESSTVYWSCSINTGDLCPYHLAGWPFSLPDTSLQTLCGADTVSEAAVTGPSAAVSLPSNPWSLTKGPHSDAGSLLEALLHTWHWHTHAHFPSFMHSLLLRQVYKPFNCARFHAGDSSLAYLTREDIFCGQLEDESPREIIRPRWGKKRESKPEIQYISS